MCRAVRYPNREAKVCSSNFQYGAARRLREICDEAGCPDISAHGGRKATAHRLAEIGATTNHIAAITGHASLAEVDRYTKAANRKRMAREAMTKLIESGA
jgi:integrase